MVEEEQHLREVLAASEQELLEQKTKMGELESNLSAVDMHVSSCAIFFIEICHFLVRGRTYTTTGKTYSIRRGTCSSLRIRSTTV